MKCKSCWLSIGYRSSIIITSEFKKRVREWELQVKSKMPRFYRMEAKKLHFNFYELETIRREIKEDLENFYKVRNKFMMFACSARIYNYINQIVSVRVVIAKFSKINEEDMTEEDFAVFKEEKQKKENGELEEERDSDDDDFEAEMAEADKLEKERLEQEKLKAIEAGELEDNEEKHDKEEFKETGKFETNRVDITNRKLVEKNK